MTKLVFEGQHLSSKSKVVLPFTAFEQKVLPGGNRKRLRVEIKLPDTTVPGIYPVRVSTYRGISQPLACGVDFLPQHNFAVPIEKLPTALTGKLEGNSVLLRHFSGKEGDQIVVSVEARRIGAAVQPVLRILDERGEELTASEGLVSISNDARCELTLPENGKYTIELHDRLYQAVAPGWFRLKIGKLHYAHFLFPLAVRRGEAGLFQLAGRNLPAKIRLKVSSATDGRQRQQWSGNVGRFSGAMPHVLLSDYDQIVEQAPDFAPQPIEAWPLGIHGRLSETLEEDQYRLTCEAGAKLRLEVFGQRVNFPIDAVLILRNEQGKQLALGDDQDELLDPLLEFTVPEGVENLVVAVRDMLGRGGDEYVYRIDVQDASQPDVQLTLDSDRIEVPSGGRTTFRINVQRRNCDGPIRIDAPGLPDGLKLTGATVPQGRNVALVQLSAQKSPADSQSVRFLGQTVDLEPKLTRPVRYPNDPAMRWQPHMREEIGLAVTRGAPFLIDWRVPEPQCAAGAVVKAVIRVARAPKFDGRIRVVLLGGDVPHSPGEAEVTEKANDATFRFSSPVEFTIDSNQEVIEVAVPPAAPPGRYQLAVVGKLLANDGQTVLATTSSTIQQIEILR